MRKRRRMSSNSSDNITDIRTLFRRFINVRMTEGASDNTLTQYYNNFEFLCEYIDGHGGNYSLEAITEDFIREWIYYMQFEHKRFPNDRNRVSNDIGLMPSTINTRLKTFRTMFNRMYNDRLIKVNPMENIRRVKEVEQEIDVLTSDEIVRLLGEMDTAYYTSFRDFVLTRTILDTMLRINEAVHIRVSDVKATEGLIVIPASIAKSRKMRIVPADDTTISLLDELAQENAYEFDNEYIFAVSDSTVYNSDNYRSRLKRYAIKAGITKNVYPHLLRHTAATRWIESGGDLEDLRRILGHSKYDMVKRYAHVADSSIVKSAKKYSTFRNLT